MVMTDNDSGGGRFECSNMRIGTKASTPTMHIRERLGKGSGGVSQKAE